MIGSPPEEPRASHGLVILALATVGVLAMLWLVGCSPQVNGPWLSLNTTIIPCATPTPMVGD